MSQDEEADVSNGNAGAHADEAHASKRERVPLTRPLAALRDHWPAVLLGLGGLATLAWVLVLAWIALQVVLWLLGLD